MHKWIQPAIMGPVICQKNSIQTQNVNSSCLVPCCLSGYLSAVWRVLFVKVLCPATVRCDASYDFICNSLHISTSGVCLTSLSSLADLQLHPKIASKTHIQNSSQKWRFVAELLPSTCPNMHSAFSRFHVHHSAVWAPVSAPSWVLKHNRGFNGALWKKHAKKSGKKMKLSQATLQVLHLCILSSNWLTSAFCLEGCVCTYHKLTNLSKYPQLFRSKVLPRPFRASASCWAAFMDSWWLCINSASSMSPQDGQLGSCIGRECTIPNKKTRKITWNIWHE